MNYLGIDLGGTNVAVAVVKDDGTIIGRGHRPCPRGNEPVAQAIIQACHDAVADAGLTLEEIHSAGLGSPGSIDAEKGIVISAWNLELQQAPLCSMISDALGIPVKIGNDANVAAYGEFLFGAGKGSAHMVAVTLGTGLGCGIVFNGKLYDGYNGIAGEAGHMILYPGGRACSCGREGCLEMYASATGLLRTARECAAEHSDSALYEATNGDISTLDGKKFFAVLERGDIAARQALEIYTRDLALGIANIVNLLQPEVVCVGGGIAGAGDVLLTPVREKIAVLDFAQNVEKRVRIEAAKLGNDAGIVGAAMLGKD